MKQRLLLALLVLFASVGTTWGQSLRADEGPTPNGSVTLTIPKGKTVTISVSGNVGNDNTAISGLELSANGNDEIASQLEDIYKLKNAISQDKASIEFVFKLCQQYETSKQALNKLKNDGINL